MKKIYFSDLYPARYHLVSSRHESCNRVRSKDECETAARELGLSDTTAHMEDTSRYPPYCYYYNGRSLYYNIRTLRKKSCSVGWKCICKGPPVKYHLVSFGTSCEHVTSKDECEAAARMLGLKNTKANDESTDILPPYCFYKNSSLSYNTRSSSNATCSLYGRCICKIENAATTTAPSHSLLHTLYKETAVPAVNTVTMTTKLTGR